MSTNFGAGAGGGAMRTLYTGGSEGVVLTGVHPVGTTALVVADAMSVKPGDYLRASIPSASLDIYQVEAVVGSTLTIPAPGLVNALPDAQVLVASSMAGVGASLFLGRGLRALEVDLDFQLPQLTGNVAYYGGQSHGKYNGQPKGSSSWDILSNYSVWNSGYAAAASAAMPDDDYAVGMIVGTVTVAVNAFYINYNPVMGTLTFKEVTAGAAHAFAPEVVTIIAIGA